MTGMELLAGVFTGLLLGLMGSGGSIVTLPALIYLAGVDVKPAMAMTFGIVAITAAFATVEHGRKGRVRLKVATVFGLTGMAGTYLGAHAGVWLPDTLQMIMFASIMLLAAWRMFAGQQVRPITAGLPAVPGNMAPRLPPVVLHGITVGIFTGMVGVGGGFLIVPALVLFSGMSIRDAVGTSLAVVTLKSVAGFAGYVGEVEIDYGMMLGFSLAAIIGSFAGTMLSSRIPCDRLKAVFGMFLVFMAGAILFDSSSEIFQTGEG
jgi:uncharacterized membrane protein YfcA